MQTFSNQHQVRSVEELLERTLYVQAKNAEIERLTVENAELRMRVAIIGDQRDKIAAELRDMVDLQIELAEAQDELIALRAQLTEVEAICATQSDNLQRYAASELGVITKGMF